MEIKLNPSQLTINIAEFFPVVQKEMPEHYRQFIQEVFNGDRVNVTIEEMIQDMCHLWVFARRGMNNFYVNIPKVEREEGPDGMKPIIRAVKIIRSVMSELRLTEAKNMVMSGGTLDELSYGVAHRIAKAMVEAGFKARLGFHKPTLNTALQI